MARLKKGLNSIIILVALSLWNPRNRCVFDGLQPNLNGILSSIREEKCIYGMSLGIEELLTSSPAASWLGLEAFLVNVLS